MNTRELNNQYLELIRSMPKQTKKQYEQLQKKIGEDATQHGQQPVHFLVMPKLFTSEIEEDLKRIAETTYNILVKVIKHYLSDPAYRKLFGFDPILEELILSSCCYEQLLPILRVDLFYDEETCNFVFCEFNTDGTSGMLEEMQITEGLCAMDAFQSFITNKQIKTYDLIDRLTEELLTIYRNSKNAKAHPTLAIVDFLQSGVRTEFEAIRDAFSNKGVNTVIADITQLEFRDGALYYREEQIDVIYRRAVTGEIMRKIDQCSAFLQAIRSCSVCTIGHIRTQIAHVKQLFPILISEQTKEILTAEEAAFLERHIPKTISLKYDSYEYDELLHNRENWIIKPRDLYGSEDVFAGPELSQNEWKTALENGITNDYLIQRFQHPYKTANARFDKDGNLKIDQFLNLSGLYVFNGKFAGIFSRAGCYAVISSRYDGCTLGTVILNE